MSFWDIVWFIVISFAFMAYLIALFQIVVDLFRDREMSGGVKAVWLVLFIFLPFVTALVYLIVRGPKMAERQSAAAAELRAEQNAYISNLAGQPASPTEEIAKAAQLRDQGQITEAEFHALKEKALA